MTCGFRVMDDCLSWTAGFCNVIMEILLFLPLCLEMNLYKSDALGIRYGQSRMITYCTINFPR